MLNLRILLSLNMIHLQSEKIKKRAMLHGIFKNCKSFRTVAND